jgi:hypothetical protein
MPLKDAKALSNAKILCASLCLANAVLVAKNLFLYFENKHEHFEKHRII